MSLLQNSNAISSGSYDINNSLRFRSSASAYLNRTPASAGNRKTFTWSAWVKRGALSSDYGIFSAGTNSSSLIDAFEFNSSNQIRLYSYNAGYLFQYVTTAVYRDPSAWYHIVVAVDTTQATATNRVKLYVNGQQVTAFSTQTDPTQNSDCNFFNAANLHAISATYNDSRYFDGYQTDINFIDGQQLTPSSFGETDTTTGSWKPKAYTGTYGTNGFYLKFSDIATTSGSNAGLGKDFSGNANYWTTNNISVTAGTTYDAMIDSPTLTSATVGNYCVLNPFLKYSGLSAPTNGNLTIAGNSANWRSILSSFAVSSGKWYCEINMTSVSTDALVGIFNINNATDLNDLTTVDNRQLARYAGGYGYQNNGNKLNNNTATAYGSTWTTGDVIGIALDMDAGTIVFYKNNTSQGTAYSSLSGLFAIGISTANGTFDPNFGQRPFSYTPPTGFNRLNTYNLPDSTIKKGNSYFDAVTYNGSNSNLTVTNAGSFQPDLVWAKSRSGAYNNILVDAIRGGNLFLSSNTTSADTTSSGLATFTSSGITWIGGASGVNASGDTYVDWMWKGGNGTSSNTSGSITSTVSVNTTAGFSVVTFTKTGTGTVKTVGHGLGVAPSFIVAKVRNGADNWPVYHISNGATFYQELNTTIAKTSSDPWGNTTPTSTVFSTKDNGTSNFVAYCWAEIAGFSKFGSYTGNGSADGTFVYTGFRPKFLLIKRTNASDNWYIFDSARSGYNYANDSLSPNISDAEYSGATYQFIDLLSNGFKLRDTYAGRNASGGTYIFMAYAENPFKNANAR